jgi:hypothetical protein
MEVASYAALSMWREHDRNVVALDSFPADLSYCLRLLIGFDAVEANHDRRLPAMAGVGSLVVVQLNHRTPTGLMSVSFFIRGIRGQADKFMSTRSLRRPASRHFVVA